MALDYELTSGINIVIMLLRVPFCKNQTNSKFRGKGRKFDFAHVLMVDSLGYDKNYWMAFWQNILLFQRNMQITKVR